MNRRTKELTALVVAVCLMLPTWALGAGVYSPNEHDPTRKQYGIR